VAANSASEFYRRNRLAVIGTGAVVVAAGFAYLQLRKTPTTAAIVAAATPAPTSDLTAYGAGASAAGSGFDTGAQLAASGYNAGSTVAASALQNQASAYLASAGLASSGYAAGASVAGAGLAAGAQIAQGGLDLGAASVASSAEVASTLAYSQASVAAAGMGDLGDALKTVLGANSTLGRTTNLKMSETQFDSANRAGVISRSEASHGGKVPSASAVASTLHTDYETYLGK
jgi:hypothetical protein